MPEIDTEQLEQENAIWPWLADGSMEDTNASGECFSDAEGGL